MDYPKCIASNQKEESISVERVNNCADCSINMSQFVTYDGMQNACKVNTYALLHRGSAVAQW